MIHKERIGDELYVYMNGSLLYKRWLNHNYGKIVFNGAWGAFSAKDTESFRKLRNEKDISNRTSSSSQETEISL